MMRRRATGESAVALGEGHDLLVAVRDGHLSRPPAAALLDLTYDEVEPGRVVLGFRPSRRFADGGRVPGGLLAGVADVAMTTAVRTTVLAATDVVLTSWSVDHLLPVALDSGPLRCEGTVVGPTEARATITDASGRPVLRAEATCRVIPPAP